MIAQWLDRSVSSHANRLFRVSTLDVKEMFVSFFLLVDRFFTSTETVGLLGTGAQDGHLDMTFTDTAPELSVKLCLFVSYFLLL